MYNIKKLSVIVIIIGIVLVMTGCSKGLSTEYVDHINKSQQYIEGEDFDGALLEVEAALKIDSDAPEAYVQKGFIHMAKGEMNQAKEAMEFVEAHIDDFKDKENQYTGLLNLGNMYYQLEQYDKSLDFFIRAKEIDDTDPALYNAIGLLYMAKGDLEKAKDNFSTVIDLDNNNFYAYGNLGAVFLKEGDYDRGLSEINTAMGQNPNIPQFYLIKGELLQGKDLIDESIEIYSEAIDKWETFGDAYYQRGELYLKNKEYLLAISDFSYAKDNGVVEGILGMGYSYKGLGQYEDAVTAFSEYLVQLDAVDLRAVYEIAISYYQLENYNEAINAVDELLTYEPKDNEALLLKAYSLEKLLKYEEAMVILKSIIEINPEHEKALEEIRFIEDNQLR